MKPVLVVDDDILLRDSLAQAFKDEGIQMEGAIDGQDGLARVKELQPSVIVLDENMPNMTGQQFIEQLRGQDWGKDVPVVVLTIKSNIEDMNKKMMFGVSDYLDKANVTTDQVVATVKKYLRAPSSGAESQPPPTA